MRYMARLIYFGLLAGLGCSQVLPDPKGRGRFHYAGLAGSGMSALAQFQVMTGGRASGSAEILRDSGLPEKKQ